MEQEESAYITSVHLKGYKSIRDVSVTLNKGLNILIGANGSGKTNFLEFLDAAYRSDYDVLLNGRKFEVEIHSKRFSVNLSGERIFTNQFKDRAYRIERKFKNSSKIYFLNEDKKLVKTETTGNLLDSFDIYQFDAFFGVSSSILYLTFENPLTSLLNKKLNLEVNIANTGSNIDKYALTTNIKANNQSAVFLNQIFETNYIPIEESKPINTILNEILENEFFEINSLIQHLKQFTPIKNIKIDWTLSRSTILEEDDIFASALIEGIDFQFYVNNEWVNWTQLSDGTKRLFYLIGSVTYTKETEIILIEEPELGVHPYQLSLLMNFLKAQSRHKQIIISTHSPQVLNCLGEDELDRIIVARHEGKAGTKLYHLSEEEKGFAAEFMKNEAFLSDYWMLSGFMNEGITENL